MPDPISACKSRFSKAFTRLQPCPIHEFLCGNLFAAFEFDVLEVQCGCCAASNVDFSRFHANEARRSTRQEFGHRLPGNVAELAAKFGEGAGPRGKAAHAVVNLFS